MFKIVVIFLFLFLYSCKENFKPLKINKNIKGLNNENLIKDTILIYDINGISTEGGEANVKYENGHIKESKLNIYGETGQLEVFYLFYSKQIKVIEKHYFYLEGLNNVFNHSDFKLNKEVVGLIDYNGIPLQESDSVNSEIFLTFKNQVPFILK